LISVAWIDVWSYGVVDGGFKTVALLDVGRHDHRGDPDAVAVEIER
jgi:hypothetical protein